MRYRYVISQLQRAHDSLWDCERQLAREHSTEPGCLFNSELQSLVGVIRNVTAFLKAMPKSPLPPTRDGFQRTFSWLQHDREAAARARAARIREVRRQIKSLRKELS